MEGHGTQRGLALKLQKRLRKTPLRSKISCYRPVSSPRGRKSGATFGRGALVGRICCISALLLGVRASSITYFPTSRNLVRCPCILLLWQSNVFYCNIALLIGLFVIRMYNECQYPGIPWSQCWRLIGLRHFMHSLYSQIQNESYLLSAFKMFLGGIC